MTGFTLATWNINSVRLRAPLVAEWVKLADPDVLCLQEIKCQNHEERFRSLKTLADKKFLLSLLLCPTKWPIIQP